MIQHLNLSEKKLSATLQFLDCLPGCAGIAIATTMPAKIVSAYVTTVQAVAIFALTFMPGFNKFIPGNLFDPVLIYAARIWNFGFGKGRVIFTTAAESKTIQFGNFLELLQKWQKTLLFFGVAHEGLFDWLQSADCFSIEIEKTDFAAVNQW
jgi:hypothetical protein